MRVAWLISSRADLGSFWGKSCYGEFFEAFFYWTCNGFRDRISFLDLCEDHLLPTRRADAASTRRSDGFEVSVADLASIIDMFFASHKGDRFLLYRRL